jgi:putative hydrolase of the HAD superfamily
MFYKGIILDLDNTLYDYTKCHNLSINACIEYLSPICQFSNSYIKECYENIANHLKHELINTASCHNKSIYFKILTEKINVKQHHVLELQKLYWNTFYENIVCFEGVLDFIEWNKKIGVKIGILTDYETEYQIEKLKHLKLLDYIDTVVTSEEVGIEKPSSKMFLHILNNMNLKADDVIMIGDNYSKDIIGATQMGIYSFFYSKKILVQFN